MKITNKLESTKMINFLNLNKLPEKIFTTHNKSEITNFLKEYPAKYYAIRDKSRSSGIFKLKVLKKDIFKETTDYQIFSLNVSSANYSENQLLTGEIEILKNNDIYLIASTNPNYSVRDAIKNPDYNFKTNIFDNHLDNIPHFNDLYKYIVDNKLINVIVEFAIFDIPVGINKENIIIYELRTNY